MFMKYRRSDIIYLSFSLSQCFTRPVLPADYPESFHESTGVVTISLLLSAVTTALAWGTHVIIVFKGAEMRERKKKRESSSLRSTESSPRVLLNYSLSIPMMAWYIFSISLQVLVIIWLSICNNVIFARDLELVQSARARYFPMSMILKSCFVNLKLKANLELKNFDNPLALLSFVRVISFNYKALIAFAIEWYFEIATNARPRARYHLWINKVKHSDIIRYARFFYSPFL